ncbi:MAG: AAA family ATPase, partial [Eggerthellaceae bacterium]|nr:AAA family ATPase [Eggerthellaceae bacterium]
IQAEIDRLSHARRDASAELEELRGRLSRTQEVVAANRAQSQMIESHVTDLQQRLDAARQADDQAQLAYEQSGQDLAAAQAEQSQARQATGLALQARDAARVEHDRAREQRSAMGARVKSLEELERARRARNPLLNWVLDHSDDLRVQVRPLVESLSAPGNLEAVVEELLGEDVQALFVEDEQAALEVASRLANVDERGSVSLLPRLASSPKVATGEARRLVDSLEYGEDVASAIEALLGDVYLFEDVAQAQAFAKKHPGACCATETGFAVWSNGKVRCRHRSSDESAVLADYRALEVARKQLEEAVRAEERAQEQTVASEDALRVAQELDLELSQRVAQLQGQVQAAQREADRASKARASLEAEQRKLEERRQKTADALAKAEPDAASLSARVSQVADDIDRLREQLDAKRSELAPQRALADQAASELSEAKLEDATCAERTAYAKRMLEACDRDIQNANRQAQRAREGMARKSASLQRVEPLMQLFSILANAARRRADYLEEQASLSQDATAGLHVHINEARAHLQAAHESYDSATQKLADVRVQKSRIGMQVEAAIGIIVDDCKTPIETAVEHPQLQDREQAEEQAGKLRRRIAGMGSINPDAASEYEQLKERYDYLRSQLDDLLTARKSLKRIVSLIDARMKDDFANTFDIVNANFKQVFAELFPGGSGSLALTDPDDMENTGVEVSAQPPGKRILKMSLMSGGEKSLTALALLFAVYKTRSTPFYILDEVEAALDDTNLRRLVAYLDTMRNDSQFIIITHQRRTMEMADVLYGISMQDDGVTKVMSQRLDKALEYAEG